MNTSETFYNSTVVHQEKITQELMIIRVRPDSGTTDFRPGQFASLGLMSDVPCVTDCSLQDTLRPIKRPYSICHPLWDEKSNDLFHLNKDNTLEFYISLVSMAKSPKKVPALTPRLFSLKEGDRIFMGPPKGHYQLSGDELKNNNHLILCSTGTGEAPHNAFVSHLLATGYEGRVTVITCAPYRKELAYFQAYEKLQQKYPQLTYIPLVTRESDTPKIYIQEYIESEMLEKKIGEQLSPKTHSFYLCGNPNMIGVQDKTLQSGAIGVLRKRGFEVYGPKTPHGQIHFEKYW